MRLDTSPLSEGVTRVSPNLVIRKGGSRSPPLIQNSIPAFQIVLLPLILLSHNHMLTSPSLGGERKRALVNRSSPPPGQRIFRKRKTRKTLVHHQYIV